MSGVRVLNYIDLGVPDGQLRLDIARIIDDGRDEGRASCFITSDILRRIAAEPAIRAGVSRYGKDYRDKGVK